MRKVKVLNYEGYLIDVKYMNEDYVDIWYEEQLALGTYGGVEDFSITQEDAGNVVSAPVNPTLPDGRAIVRADSRALGTQTYFTMVGDSATGIGDGVDLRWDFSNQDNEVKSDDSNWRIKHVDLTFIDPIYLKDGAIYFFNAQKGGYVRFAIICPQGQYYLDNNGQPGYAFTEGQPVHYFVMKHFMTGNCPMGDELNAEGAQENPIPVGYILRGIIVAPSTDSDSHGYASLEMYRKRSVLFPGEEV